MDNLNISDWGIAVGVLFYITRELIKIVQGQLAKRNGGGDSDSSMIKDLWDWHNIKDRDGVFIWYVRPSLAEAIISLSHNIGEQTRMMKEQTKILEQLAHTTQETLEHVK